MRLKDAGRLLGVSTLVVSLLLGVACGDDDDDADSAIRDTGATVTAPQSANDSGSEADFSIGVQDQLTQLQNDLAELETQAATLDDSARAEVDPMIEELRTTITTLENRLVDLQATPDGPDREAVKAEIEDTLAQAQTQVDRIQAAVGI